MARQSSTGAVPHASICPTLRLRFVAMDELSSARAALTRAIEDVQRAMARVRAAQEVDWVSVMASRYREELYGAIHDLTGFREALEQVRMRLA